ncbi:sodium-coupled monocarboxylate transporter 1-like [Phymastichus coffea]|uniref:sodium-coupled monocarboxylate transporter 1-like n=1 Tax=Phymastichus coffea TaxID=108790 RepID=UPI00273AB846|nr:sodium-coupled monocarboxylate transporter 1-like [Phymastichus coffea]
MDQFVFSWIDYVIFISLLGISLLIGFYYGFCSKQNSVTEYLFGGKTMGYIPVAISILASIFSGIALLGVPTEVYLNGAIFIYNPISTILSSVFTAYVTLPIFHKLQVKSSYDYLELRFSKTVKKYASVLYTVSLIIYIPMVIYGPAIAFSQATGYSLYLIAPTVCIICITYTTIGGVKAVVWTDTIQFVFTAGGLLTVLIVGIHSVGGFSKLWQISSDGGRLELNKFSLSPFERYTFWNMVVAGFFVNLSYTAVGQKFVQRFLSISDLKDMQKAVWLNMIGGIAVFVCIVITGLIIYAYYHDCDPISAKLIEREDQIISYYVLEITKNLPGISGMFFAGTTSSALSTMSASINSLSGIVYDNFIANLISESPNNDAKAACIMKIISAVIGVISIGLIFGLEYMGTLIDMSFSIRGAVEGPLVGFFLAGMFVPWIGNLGAITGVSASFLIMAWITIGAKWHSINKTIRYSHLPMSIENCTDLFNVTSFESVTLPPLNPENEPWIIFRLSFFCYILTGCMLTIILGLIVSIIMKESNLSEVNPEHIAPLIRRFLPKKKYEEVPINEKCQIQNSAN